MMKTTNRILMAALLWLTMVSAHAQSNPAVREYMLGAGDVVRVMVFQNPDLTAESRVSETGSISYPLIGAVPVGGLSLAAAERKIAQMLKEGNFVVQPQVTMQLVQVRANQVAVLGMVNRPGRYPMETFNARLSDMLAVAGGVAIGGADTIFLTGVRDGKPYLREIDVARLLTRGGVGSDVDLPLSPGDTLYVDRAPMFYIYGEVQRPGTFRLERDMTVMQGLALGGGITMRGTMRGMQVHRRDADGSLKVLEPALTAQLQPNDVIYVRESMF